MTDRKIIDVRKTTYYGGPPGDPAWIIDFIREDGVKWCYAIPHSAFANRAAEYGLDPQDINLLMDVVLGEHVLAAQGMGITEDDPNFLYNTDQETARLHYLAKISAAKSSIPHNDASNLLQKIRDHHKQNFDFAAYDAHRRVSESIRAKRLSALKAGNQP